MRLESALYASGSGISSHGQALAVIGDNIANSNTVAFKTQRVRFSDLYSEGAEGRQTSANEPIGSGVEASEVQQVFDTGVLDFTDRNLDVAITGNGFLAVGAVGTQEYTRAGNLIIDGNGFLSTSNGQNVLGYSGESTTLGTIDMLSLDLSGNETTTATVAGNLSSSDPVIEELLNGPASFLEIGQNSSFTGRFTAFDSLGEEHGITLAFSKSDVNTYVVQAYIDAGEVGGEAGIPQQIGENLTLSFTENGLIAEEDVANSVMTLTPGYSNGAAEGNFTLDFSDFTQFGAASNVNTLAQDGEGTGDIEEYRFDTDGTILAVLGGGTEVTVGRVPIAIFSNVEGLNRSGSSRYTESDVSGAPNFGIAGTSGFGELIGGALERSNVDIGNQFVELVVLQRGYQANSQVFSATGDIVRDTINLIR